MTLTSIDVSCRAVLFDCDGVLVDSTDSGERAWRQWSREYGLDDEAVLDGVHGRRSTETVSMFLPAKSRADGLTRIEAIEIADAGSTKPIRGAPELLAALPGNWAVVTSASRALLHSRLEAAGLPTPVVAVTGSDVRIGKPAPDGYLQAAERLGRSIFDCVVVEDSVAGVQAGQAACAFHVLGVGERALITEADTVVRDLSGISWTGAALRVPTQSVLRLLR